MYRFVRTILWLISLLPFSVLYAISDFCCLFVSRFYRTKVVRENLQNAFPDKSAEELKRIESGFYHQFCDNFVETIKVLSMSREEMMDRMTFSGLEYAKEKLDMGQKFIFVYLSHFGNWEWVASLRYHTGDWAETGQIYHHIYNKVMNRLFLEMRSTYGGVNIEMKETLRKILNMRNDDKRYIIGFISDQQPKWNSIHHFTHFLGRDTAVFTGTEQIARKVDAVIMYGKVSRPKRGHYHFHITPMEDHPATAEPNTLTDCYMHLLEQDIVQHPEMWLWSHKRWSRTKEEWERRKAEK